MPVVGQVYKMSINFGNQVRLKCPHCKVFMRVSPQSTCNRCGTEYQFIGFGEYRVVALRG